MKKSIFSKFNFFAMLLIFLGVIGSCSVEDNEAEPTEPVKDISGTWRVTQAFRNEENISEVMDFSQFRLNFNGNAYSFENYLPFLVKEQGTYSLNDPQYPTKISFVAQNAEESVDTQLNMPVSNGKRQMNLTFSPGCSSNTYTYIFERVEE